jgi:hypothetical protein
MSESKVTTVNKLQAHNALRRHAKELGISSKGTTLELETRILAAMAEQGVPPLVREEPQPKAKKAKKKPAPESKIEAKPQEGKLDLKDLALAMDAIEDAIEFAEPFCTKRRKALNLLKLAHADLHKLGQQFHGMPATIPAKAAATPPSPVPPAAPSPKPSPKPPAPQAPPKATQEQPNLIPMGAITVVPNPEVGQGEWVQRNGAWEWVVYARQDNPAVAESLKELAPKAPRAPRTHTFRGTGVKLFGQFSISSVCHWLGGHGWSKEEAVRTLTKLGVEIGSGAGMTKLSTVVTGLSDGKPGSKYARPAQLQEDHIQALHAARDGCKVAS